MWKRILLGAVLTIGLLPAFASAQYPSMHNHRRNPFPQETYYEKMANQWVRLYLNRLPTQREVLLITAQLRSGKTHEEVQANIISSDEYYRKSGYNMSNFIRKLFLDVLGRNATPAEVGMLIGKATAYGRYRFALEFLVANRGLNRGAPVFPPIILSNYNLYPFLPF